ncbi:uncharacterized protein LOC128720161 [Anopheles nili]|uniref:uncharacterized protein LOC128720161 n=1 Tax=Anopheles nili TaxID=185578 RepID=UPI00237AD0BB|nr:uncharacterized protein LOC128720161 [Anopheles nili]
MCEADLRTPEHRNDGPFCRLCFSLADDLCPLFPSSHVSPNNALLLHKILDCTTITLSVHDDHDAYICAKCIVSIEAFFKYKAQCVENDRTLRKKRKSFFTGLGLAADKDDRRSLQSANQLILAQERHQRHLPASDRDDVDDEGESVKQRKRHRRTPHVDEVSEGNALKKPRNGLLEEEYGDRQAKLEQYQVKQEIINPNDVEEHDTTNRKEGLGDDEEDDDEEEYFNPNQFLAQETQIDEEGDAGGDLETNDNSTDGEGHSPIGVDHPSGSHLFERGWKATEFSPQPGSSGLKALKITDYSNITGKRGRPQRFVAEMLAGASNLMQYQQHGEAVLQDLLRLNGLANVQLQPEALGQMTPLSSSPQGPGRRLPASIEPTKKVQKFLDDGLRELIYNAGAPNPHFERDGGSTEFMVVKARFNSYNIIFDDNRFLRRNKSVSGLAKWYWACSVTGCPVKICSYAGRLFKTNELPHTHPPTESDARNRYETIQPDPVEAAQLQRQLLLQQQQQHQQQQQRLLRQQQQQQLLRQRQVELAQRRVAAAAALMAAAAVSATRNDDGCQERSKKIDPSLIVDQQQDWRRNYDLHTASDGTERLLFAGHNHGLIMTRKDGVKIYRCTSVIKIDDTPEESEQPCLDTVFLHANGRIAMVCKEEMVDYDMELPVDTMERHQSERSGGNSTEEDDKRRRPQKIIVYEGYRYKYCHARPEGSFYWRCVLRHDKDCLASIQTKRNLEFLNVNDQAHNHDPPDPSEPHENAMLCEIRLPIKGESTEGSTDFQLVKSGQKREFLIYKGYRYYFQYESKNGRRSYRCTMFKNCPAGAFLLPNNTIQEAKNFIHTHPPVEDMEKYITKDSLITSPIKHPTEGSADESREDLGIVDWPDSTGAGSIKLEPLSKDPEVAQRNGYRIIKNYKNKEIMIYLGWRYFEDYKKKSGGQVWRCSSHRLCRGSVHLFQDGSINFAKLVDHNHSPPKKIASHSPLDGSSSKAGSEHVASPEQQLSTPLDSSCESLLGGGGAYHRYIMHQGHRFRFATRKREGTIYWRCAMRLETKCPVSFHTKEDTYELVSTRNHEHNHPIPTVWPDVAGGQIDEELPSVRMPAEEIGTTDFNLTKNSKGRDLVLYKNGRFYLDYSRKDGKIVFRCSAVSGCRATVHLLPNKTLQVPDDFSHNHPTPYDGEAGDHTVRESEADQQPIESIELKSDDEEQDTQAVQSRFVLYNGFHFRFISRHPTEQSAFFRCFNFDAKKNPCHASLYTDQNGRVIQTSQHPHNHEQGDYLQGLNTYHQLQEQEEAQQPPKPPPKTTDELIGTRDYKIVKNWKNRDVLVFQNCRYFLHYVRKDGRKVWRCSAIRSCHAAVYLNADGTVDQFRGQHVHEIRPEGELRRRRRRKKSEPMFPFGAGSGDSTMFGNGMHANTVDLTARGASLNGIGSLLNGSAVSLPAGVNGSTNGSGQNGGLGNEWIDYSDYGIQMNAVSANDTGNGDAGRTNEENHSLWDHIHPIHSMVEAGGNESEAGIDLSYHSVFGNQENFNTYAVHALAQHHLQQQQQRSHISLQQLQQHHQMLLMNGGLVPQHRASSNNQDSSDAEECDVSAGATSGDDHPVITITPEVKIEGEDL